MGRPKKKGDTVDDRVRRIADEAYKNDIQSMKDRIRETPFEDLPPSPPPATVFATNKEMIDYFVEKMSTEIAAKLSVLMPTIIKPPTPGVIAKSPTEEQVRELNNQMSRLFDLFMEYAITSRLSRI